MSRGSSCPSIAFLWLTWTWLGKKQTHSWQEMLAHVLRDDWELGDYGHPAKTCLGGEGSTHWPSVAMWKPCWISRFEKSLSEENSMCKFPTCKSRLKIFENTADQTSKICVPNMADGRIIFDLCHYGFKPLLFAPSVLAGVSSPLTMWWGEP